MIELPKSEYPLLKMIFGDVSSKMKESIIKSELGNEVNMYNNIKQLAKMQGVLTLMPYQFNLY
jgi:hypothetical protein